MRKILNVLGYKTSIILSLIGLTACQSDNLTTGVTYANDYRVRHPIALTYAPINLDLFIDRRIGGLDNRQNTDLRNFINKYRSVGQGPLIILIPYSSNIDHRDDFIITNKIISLGIAKKYLKINKYNVLDSSLAAPVRLSFTTFQAKVASECGNWAQDIGGLQVNFANWQNKPWYNMGCAYQSQFAAQVADPIDLVRPQSETRSDTEKRMYAFGQLRKGKDPSTQWSGGEASVKGGD